MVILSSKLQQVSGYQNLPPDWNVGVSDNGWIIDELGVERVKHFNRRTLSCTKGSFLTVIVATPL